MLKNLYKGYSLLLLLVFTLVSVPAMATPLWVAVGLQEITTQNPTGISYSYYSWKSPNLHTEADCSQFITDTNSLVPGNNLQNGKLLQKVHAKCVEIPAAN